MCIVCEGMSLVGSATSPDTGSGKEDSNDLRERSRQQGMEEPLFSPTDIFGAGLGGLGKAGLKTFLRLFGSTAARFGANTVGAAQVRIIQYGGRKIGQTAADALNEAFETDLSRRAWGRVVEALKKDNLLPPDFHGNIDALGNYMDKAGKIIGNLGEYLP